MCGYIKREVREESPIGIASSPTQPGYLEFTVQKAGVVTEFEEDGERKADHDRGAIITSPLAMGSRP
jgi:NAD(P)H-flavin reductase